MQNQIIRFSDSVAKWLTPEMDWTTSRELAWDMPESKANRILNNVHAYAPDAVLQNSQKQSSCRHYSPFGI